MLYAVVGQLQVLVHQQVDGGGAVQLETVMLPVAIAMDIVSKDTRQIINYYLTNDQTVKIN